MSISPGTPELVETWHEAYAAMATSWAPLGRPPSADVDLAEWASSYAWMREKEELLRSTGRWVSGATDLLTIARVVDSELVHSAVVAWLLDPTSRHGLGDALLARLLAAGWPDADQPIASRARVDREVVRVEAERERRADVVVTAGRMTLVVENKVWSDESEAQCEDLYQLWSDGVSDVRFLLLSLDGHPPRQTKSRAAAEAWRSISYRSLAALVAEVSQQRPSTAGTCAVVQYLASLEALVGHADTFTVSNALGAFDD